VKVNFSIIYLSVSEFETVSSSSGSFLTVDTADESIHIQLKEKLEEKLMSNPLSVAAENPV